MIVEINMHTTKTLYDKSRVFFEIRFKKKKWKRENKTNG